jgi:hypothetical protein
LASTVSKFVAIVVRSFLSALSFNWLRTVVEKSLSWPRALANSFKVSNCSGASAINFVILLST